MASGHDDSGVPGRVRLVRQSSTNDDPKLNESSLVLLNPDVTEKVKSIDFACSAKVLPDISAHHFLQWQTDGECVPIPVSQQDIGNLSDLFGPSLDPGRNFETFGSLTSHLRIGDFDLGSAVVQHLRLPSPIQIVVKFVTLVLYNDKNCSRNYLPSREHAMKIGTAVLQLPVEGGHQGGSLNVTYREQSKRFDTDRSSDTSVYLYAFYDCCKHFIEPVSRGHQLIAVYDIHWVNAEAAIFKDFPWFLASIQQMWEDYVSGSPNGRVGYEEHGRPKTIFEKPLTGTTMTRDSRQVAQFCSTFGPPVLAGATRRRRDGSGQVVVAAAERGTATNASPPRDLVLGDLALPMTFTVDTHSDAATVNRSFGVSVERNSTITLSNVERNFWNGALVYRNRDIRVGMHSVVDNTSSALQDSELPNSLLVFGTVASATVWNYLEAVERLISEIIVVFQITPATADEIAGYMDLYDWLMEKNSHAVLRVAAGAPLPGRFKDIFVASLSKESPMPWILSYYVKPSFEDGRKADYLMGIAVIRMPVIDLPPWLTAKLKPKKRKVSSRKAIGAIEPVEKTTLEEATATAAGSANIPHGTTSLHRPLQANNPGICPVKADSLSKLSKRKSSSLQPTTADGSLDFTTSPARASCSKGETPSEATFASSVPCDSEQGPMTTTATRHGLTAALSGLEPDSFIGPATRSRTKRNSAAGDRLAPKRIKHVPASEELISSHSRFSPNITPSLETMEILPSASGVNLVHNVQMTSHQTTAIVSKVVGEVTRSNNALPSIDTRKPSTVPKVSQQSITSREKGKVDVSMTLSLRSLPPPLLGTHPSLSTSANLIDSSSSKFKTVRKETLNTNIEGATALEMSKPSGSEVTTATSSLDTRNSFTVPKNSRPSFSSREKGKVHVSKSHRRLPPTLLVGQPRPSTSTDLTDSFSSKVKPAKTNFFKTNSEDQRSNVRCKLAESLWKRLQLAKDKETDHAVVEQVAVEIEEAFHKSLDEVKYVKKYRTLILNISNVNNSRLYLDIVKKRLSPDELVKMSNKYLTDNGLSDWRKEQSLESSKDMIPVIESCSLDRTENGTRHAITKNADNGATRSRSVAVGKINVTSSNLNSSRCDLDTISKPSPKERSDGDKTGNAEERDHYRSSRSRGETHKAYSDRREKNEKKKRKKDIVDSAQLSDTSGTDCVGKLCHSFHPRHRDGEVSISASAEGAELLPLREWSKQRGKSQLAQGGVAGTQVVALPSAGGLRSHVRVGVVQESRFAGLLVGTEEDSFSSTDYDWQSETGYELFPEVNIGHAAPLPEFEYIPF